MVTSRDVAQHAGVSQATVSRVLNGSPRVSATTIARVQDAIAALDYHPNAAAASMKTRRTGTIGIIIDQLSNPFFVEVLESLAQVFADAGQRVLVWDPSHHEDAAIRALRDRTVDGVVIAAWQDDSPAMQAALASGRPVVMLNRRPSGTGFDSVTSENRAGGRPLPRRAPARAGALRRRAPGDQHRPGPGGGVPRGPRRSGSPAPGHRRRGLQRGDRTAGGPSTR
jgi:LacI family transcriptional regulator